MNERWPLYPQAERALKKMGNDLRDARRLRRISTTTLAECARIMFGSMSALRYSTDGGITFQHSDEGANIPPILDLLPLHHAAEHLCRDTATPAGMEKDLKKDLRISKKLAYCFCGCIMRDFGVISKYHTANHRFM